MRATSKLAASCVTRPSLARRAGSDSRITNFGDGCGVSVALEPGCERTKMEDEEGEGEGCADGVAGHGAGRRYCS
jgi:hypothetical protein